MTLQRVSFVVPGGELEGTLHLPDARAIGGVAVLHGFGGDPEQPHVIAACEALSDAGVAALRFAYRDHEPPRMTLASGLADASGAVRLLKAHPDVPGTLGVVGFSFGGAIAALAAGRDSRIRAAVLAAAPARFGDDDRLKPFAEVTRTRARVLLIWGSRDTQVPITNAERYAAVLSQARVRNETVIIEGGDHDFAPAGPRQAMANRVAEWCRDSFAT